MRIIIFGAPGVGKGTQAKIIAAKLNIAHISTGDILRAAIKNETELGLQAKAIVERGELVPDTIVGAIINDPDLVLADEPTGNLDLETSDEIIEILKKINQRGTSILLATHNYEIVRKVDAKIIRLENGKAVKVMIKKKDDNQG